MQPHPVDTVPPLGQLFALGAQHVLAMYAGAVAVPLILGGALHLRHEDLAYLVNADLATCGVASILQALGVGRFIGARLPLMQGCTFAAVTPMVLIGTSYGLPAVYGAVIVSGVAMFLAAPFFSRLLRFFPPAVTGSVITTIGLSLLPVAVLWTRGIPGTPGFGSGRNVAVAGAVLALVVAVLRFAGGFFARVAVLAGIVAGTALAAALGMVRLEGVHEAAWIGVTTPFHFGAPTFHGVAVAAMLVVMLVTMTETSADLLAVGEMVGRPASSDDVARALRADGIATALGGLLNAFPYTAFAQNVGLVGITGVRSRFVVVAAGALLVVLGLVPALGEIVAAVPTPVLGGAGIVMFGTVAVSGIRTLARVDFERTGNVVVVAVSLGVGLVPVATPDFYAAFPAWAQIVLNSGISMTAVTAVALNLLFFRGRVSE